jgi:hypothetical protein
MASAAMLIFILILTLPLLFRGNTSENVKKGTENDFSWDTTAPVIKGVKNLTVYKGESVAYRKNIILDDNSGSGNVTLTVDSSKVNTDKPGTYVVYYIATDKAGNKTSVSVFVTVIEPQIPLEKLNAAVDNVIAAIITDGMSKEAQCRAVYSYIQGHIAYASTSDKSDWRAEAYRALFVSGTGDCFSFFAAAKAFLDRLGIENLDIQRTPGLLDETHYWSLVNIGTSAQPRWYHFDATRLRAEYNHSGCLLTEVQIEAYNHVRKNFYAYDKSAYPEICNIIITPTPELEPYYNN